MHPWAHLPTRMRAVVDLLLVIFLRSVIAFSCFHLRPEGATSWVFEACAGGGWSDFRVLRCDFSPRLLAGVCQGAQK